MSRVFWRETPKQLLLFERQNVSLNRNVPKVLRPFELMLENRHNASRNLSEQPSRLSLSRESLADHRHHSSGAYHAGMDWLIASNLCHGMVDCPAIFHEVVV